MKNLLRPCYANIEDLFLRLKHFYLTPAFSCHSHLTTKERIKLYELCSGRKLIAEIGSYVGASACCFGASVLKQGEGKIICIDTWNNDAMTEGVKDTWSTFLENTSSYKQFIIPIRGYSTNVTQQAKALTPYLDLLFIDGDHSYDGVKADWEAYRGFLRPDALVIFHDIGWAEGVQRVVNEDVMPFCCNHGSLPNLWWGTIAEHL